MTVQPEIAFILDREPGLGYFYSAKQMERVHVSRGQAALVAGPSYSPRVKMRAAKGRACAKRFDPSLSLTDRVTLV